MKRDESRTHPASTCSPHDMMEMKKGARRAGRFVACPWRASELGQLAHKDADAACGFGGHAQGLRIEADVGEPQTGDVGLDADTIVILLNVGDGIGEFALR